MFFSLETFQATTDGNIHPIPFKIQLIVRRQRKCQEQVQRKKNQGISASYWIMAISFESDVSFTLEKTRFI